MLYVILAYISYPFVRLASRFFCNGSDSILVFQTAKIGDMICTTPVFREIKRAHPGIRIGVVADPVTAPLLKFNPHIDEIIEFKKEWKHGLGGKLAFARELRARRFSAALILMPNTTNILAALWSMTPKRVAIHPDYAGRTQRRLLRLSTALEYHQRPGMAMETYLKSLRHFGVKGYGTDKEVYGAPGSQTASGYLKGSGLFAGVILGTGNDLKDWGTDNFIGLVRLILEKTGVRAVVLLGSDKERDKAALVIDKTGGHGRVVDLCGRFGLSEMPEVLKKMSVVIGVDTGLVYMADALGVPVVDIAGPCDMDDQRPTGKRSFIIQKKDLPCVPCSHTFKAPYECRYGHRECVKGITVEEVFNVSFGV